MSAISLSSAVSTSPSTVASPQIQTYPAGLTRDLSGIKRTSVAWIYTTNVNGQGDTTVNLAGFIKGEVNGSWKPRTATQYVETTDPIHFTNLSNTFHIPLSDWGVL